MREKAGMTWAYRDLAVFLTAAGKLDEARAALAEFNRAGPRQTLTTMRAALRFMHPKLLANYVEGLRIAGMPEA